MDDTEPSSDDGSGTPPACQVLTQVRAEAPSDRVTVGDILDGAGPRVYGLTWSLFALPEALPLPIVGLTAIVAIPLAIVSVRLILFGTERKLPDWTRRRSKYLEWPERFARPRMPEWTNRGRLFGVVCLLLTVMLVLPIPFGNVGPALCTAGIGFGILQQDGAIVAVTLGLSVLTLAGMSAAIYAIGWAALDVTGGLLGG